MKERLIQYGFTEETARVFGFEKKGWLFRFWVENNSMLVYSPTSGDEDNLQIINLTYEKTIKLIEFICDYE